MAIESGSEPTFTATYLDTPDRRLTRAGIPLRRRVEKGKSTWEARIGDTTVSAPGGPAKPPAELQRVLAALLRGDDVVQVARLRRGEDDVVLLDGQRVLASYDDMDAALAEALERPSQEAAPPKSAPAVEHLRAYLRAQLEAIERHDPAVRVGSDAEDLHKLRVAVRRSRAALREARALLGDEQGRTLRDELEWLGGRLGPARDLDVLIARLRREVAELDGPDAVPATKIVAQLEQEREAAQRELLETLESERYANVLALLGQVVDTPQVTTSDISLTDLTRREFRKLKRQVDTLGPTASNDALHRARIQAKRLRYATELSSQLLGKKGDGVVSAAKTFQDVVGAHQDAVVAEQYIRHAVRRSRGVGAGIAAGRLIERERARRVEARAGLPEAWKHLERRATKIWG
ncbi:MAG TPA: CHAD domain-containing protein [Gaiellaceae bacterium]|nr:CHAD domain-containing protein [Gaiellaceae bacterium]